MKLDVPDGSFIAQWLTEFLEHSTAKSIDELAYALMLASCPETTELPDAWYHITRMIQEERDYKRRRTLEDADLAKPQLHLVPTWLRDPSE